MIILYQNFSNDYIPTHPHIYIYLEGKLFSCFRGKAHPFHQCAQKRKGKTFEKKIIKIQSIPEKIWIDQFYIRFNLELISTRWLNETLLQLSDSEVDQIYFFFIMVILIVNPVAIF